jgi:uncharacterized protein with PIN domain
LTAPGRPRSTSRRAIEHGNLLVAEAVAREMGKVSLAEALELTALIAVKDPRRLPRVAARWLRRYPDECEGVTIADAMLAASALNALGRPSHEAAVSALMDMAEAAFRRNPLWGVG